MDTIVNGLRAELNLDQTADSQPEKPFPIQEASIPLILDGFNVIGVSETGSGKSICFILGALCSVRVENKETQSVIISESNDLLNQISDVCAKIAKPSGIAVARLQHELRAEAQVVIGNPLQVLLAIKDGAINPTKVCLELIV